MTEQEIIELFVEKMKTMRLTKSGPETLDAAFLGAMQEVGLFGLLKHGEHSFAECKTRPPVENGGPRNMMKHAMEHMGFYVMKKEHELGDCRYHLAAAAFNLMIEFYFYQKERGN